MNKGFPHDVAAMSEMYGLYWVGLFHGYKCLPFAAQLPSMARSVPTLCQIGNMLSREQADVPSHTQPAKSGRNQYEKPNMLTVVCASRRNECFRVNQSPYRDLMMSSGGSVASSATMLVDATVWLSMDRAENAKEIGEVVWTHRLDDGWEFHDEVSTHTSLVDGFDFAPEARGYYLSTTRRRGGDHACGYVHRYEYHARD